uniref:RGS domain-containing protein n=1 Tax=Denticeps clupeoides TaxID=299321 RepID=A0AAY4CGF5_9TELE
MRAVDAGGRDMSCVTLAKACNGSACKTRDRKTSWSRFGYFLKNSALHRRPRMPTTDELDQWAESLDVLLGHKYGVVAFKIFSKMEFCEENVEFWLACEEFKRIKSSRKLAAKAKRIYEEFIESESPQEVRNINVTYMVAKRVRKQTRNRKVAGSNPRPPRSLSWCPHLTKIQRTHFTKTNHRCSADQLGLYDEGHDPEEPSTPNRLMLPPGSEEGLHLDGEQLVPAVPGVGRLRKPSHSRTEERGASRRLNGPNQHVPQTSSGLRTFQELFIHFFNPHNVVLSYRALLKLSKGVGTGFCRSGSTLILTYRRLL